MTNEQWVLEWSRKTNNFHIQKLADALAQVQHSFVMNSANDYKIIMVGPKEVCHQMADTHRHRLSGRVA